MKRAPLFVVAGAAAGFVGVLGLHHPHPASSVAAAAPGSGSGGRHTASAPAPSSSPSTAQGPSSSPSAAPGGKARTATGTLEQYGYGELNVKVSVSGSRITDVVVPTLRAAEPYSQQLAQQAIPMLKSEVLNGQSAHINGVSGATYTSEAYALSLQAALDKLHVK